jgi:adenosyl cobinamide kinase/adenosyl cobinamide phosphate guanylyltransferase
MCNVVQNSQDLVEFLGVFYIADLTDLTDEKSSKSRSPFEATQKKTSKLESVLGEEIGTKTLIKQIETHFFRDIVSWIEHDVTDVKEQSMLKQEIDRLRRVIAAKVAFMSKDLTFERNP